MTIEDCHALTDGAIETLLEQVRRDRFEEMNEATLQHHLALNLHLDSLKEANANISMTLEKKVRRTAGVFPKKSSRTASVDIFFRHDDGTRYAVELKCFQRANHREPNNRYDAYADLANLEVYLDEHADAGIFILLTDHPHYFDEEYQAHSDATADFSLREDHRYAAGRVLTYNTEKKYGPDLTLRNSYHFTWRGRAQTWRALVVKVER